MKYDILIKEEVLNLPLSKKEYKRKLNDVPDRLLLEEIGNSITHGVGFLLAIAMFILMLLKSNNTLKITSSIVYGVSMIILMGMSSLYHAFPNKSRVKILFRRFDYSSIYLLIGGTYAPILLLLTGGMIGNIIFISQWILISVGITFISIFGPGRLKLLHYSLYFIIGWGSAFFVPLFNGNNNQLCFWIAVGGIIYTLGMIPFCIKKSNCAHFIWHFFVLFGCICQCIGIYSYLY
jgi:hemolysin III